MKLTSEIERQNKQLLRILKRQALVVNSQENDKMVSIGGFFINLDTLASIMLKCAIKTDVKKSNILRNSKVFIFVVRSWPFLFSLTTAYCNAE